MLRVALLLLVCFASLSVQIKWFELEGYTFEHYVSEFRRSYSSESEHQLRKKIFEENYRQVLEYNSQPEKTWKMGINHFSDRTEEEKQAVLGYQIRDKKGSRNYQPQPFVSLEKLPKEVDWRQKNIISDVKDQGNCGSCWTFATAETVESYWALATGQLTDLSEQQILDCTQNPNHCGGTGGCGGGTEEIAYQWIMKAGGLASEWVYPYVSYFGKAAQCSANSTNFTPFAKISNYTDLPSNVYDPVFQHLATNGPLAVSVDASSWFAYESGVYNGCNQTNPDLDHAVQLVGYGTDDKLGDYWIVRNSWSPTWGEAGYIRIYRTSETQCGMDITPSHGNGCDGGPDQVKVCGTCGILYDASFPIVSA
eukprot:CAMPEP_0174250906 /NCGR_PEP_ID=MMETSP0439-20130205/919_1 /TAXON_ID=0 /ORGANISM="Stereomyxa ramosa, Strain Chinc5" /LENGTH=365 /DNA_ID=CAMNT_0015331089 /DNA_START=25 /DNA_END=1122 /DNA_ORIENTATION=-